jgi:hypothetical protein
MEDSKNPMPPPSLDGRPFQRVMQWLPAWRGHVADGRAVACGYETSAQICSKPGVAGRQPMDCERCSMGTLQNRFARLARAAVARSALSP